METQMEMMMLLDGLTTRQALTRDVDTLSAAPHRGRIALVLDLPASWTGTLSPTGDAAPTHFVLHRDPSADGAWMRFEADGTGLAAVRLLEASGTAVVALIGPYRDPATGVSLHTLMEGRISASGFLGTFRTLRADRANTVTGVFTAEAREAAA